MQIENNIYKLNSNIDLKEYAKSKINLDATGDLEKVSFSIKSDDLKVLNLKENIDIKDIKLIGNYDIKNSNLDISTLTSNLNYEQIFTKLDAKANLLNNDLDSLKFQANFYTTIKKSIYKSLEKDLNIPLFIRDSRKVNLTQYGQTFLTYAERILQELETARQDITNMAEPDSGVVNLSFMHSLGVYLVPELLKEFRKIYPKIQFRLIQNHSFLLSKQLFKGIKPSYSL